MSIKKLKPREDDLRLTEAIEKFDKHIDLDTVAIVDTTIGTMPLIPIEAINKDDKLVSLNDTIDSVYYEYLPIERLFAAPSEWNLWSPYSLIKKVEMMESIKEIGLQQNIVVWKVPKGIIEEFDNIDGYMVLAGHNRVDSVRSLFHIYKEDRFATVYAKIYVLESIDEGFAKKIIDDTNLIGRDKTPKEISEAYVRRICNMKESDKYKGVSERSLQEILASEENKSRTHVFQHLQIRKCIDPIAKQIGSVINFKAGLKLASLDEEIQEHFYNEYYLKEENRHLYTNKNIMKLNEYMLIDTIKNIFEEKSEKIVVSYEINLSLKEGLDKLVNKFINANKL